MAHQLDLYFSEPEIDCNVISVTDVSLYDPLLSVQNPTLRLKVPGSDDFICVTFKLKGTTYITSNSLGLTAAACGIDLLSLPDGVYEFEYSVCPNDEVIIRPRLLRDCQTRNAILGRLTCIILQDCCEDKILDQFGRDITKQTLQVLRDLLVILDIARVDCQNLRYKEADNKLIYVSRILQTL